MAEKVQVILEFDSRNVKVLDEAKLKTEKVSNAANKFGLVAAAAFSAVALAARRMVAESIKAYSSFEKKLSNISTLIDTNTESTKQMGRELLDLSKRVPVAVDDLSTALYDVRSAGISASEAMNVLEEGARLGVAGLGSAKEATGALTLALNTFGDSTHDAARISDILFKTVKFGVTTISDVASGFGQVSSIAKETNISLEELQAATAAMTITNKSAMLSQTSLRAAITAIISPTDDMKEIIKVLGFESGATMLKQKGLVGTMDLLKKATGGNIEILSEAYGRVEGLKAQLALTGTVADDFKKIMSGMKDETSLVNEAFDKQNETLESLMTTYKNKITAEQIRFGGALALGIRFLIKYNEWLDIVKEKFTVFADVWIEKTLNMIGLVKRNSDESMKFVQEQILNDTTRADLAELNSEKIINASKDVVKQSMIETERRRQALEKINADAKLYQLQNRQALQEEFEDKRQKLLAERAEMEAHWAFQLTGAKLNADNRKMVDKGVADSFTSLTSLMQTKDKRAFEIGKASAVAQATFQTYQAAQAAFTSLAGIPIIGPALAAVAAGAAIVSGLFRVSQIKATQMPAMQYGGVIPGTATGTPIIAGENFQREAIVPLNRGIQNQLGLGGDVNLHMHFHGPVLANEDWEQELASRADRALEKLRQMKRSAFAYGVAMP